MSINSTADSKTVSELASHTREIIEQLRSGDRPLTITVDGKPAAVLLGVDQYEWLLHLLNLTRLLREGEADLLEGRVQPLEEFFDELDREQKAGSSATVGIGSERNSS
jgi:prevent-host-death family protein